jgi:hypothetical protein
VVIPTAALRESLTVEPFRGNGPRGKVFDAPTVVAARVTGQRRVVRRQGATEVISSATALIRPESMGAVTVDSRVQWRGRRYDVLDVLPLESLTRPEGAQVLLG